jgi:hypothetical protein
MKSKDPELAKEQIINLCRNYEGSGSKALLSFIYFVLDYFNLDLFSKIECVFTIYNSNIKCYTYFENILSGFINLSHEERPSIPIYIDLLKYLTATEEELPISKHIEWLIFSSGLSDDFLYLTIQSFQKDNDRKINQKWLDLFYNLFYKKTTSSRFKILSSQYLFQRGISTIDLEQDLISIMEDPKTEYNIRADAADTVMKYGTVKAVQIASNIIKELGKNTKDVNIIYNNKQNVHIFDDSVNSFLQKLGAMQLEKINDRFYTFENAEKELLEYLQKTKYINQIDAVNGSLIRIKLDQSIYTASQSLSYIFLKIYIKIIKNSNKDMLLNRLIEELIDMNDTCSTGHVNRLVNVFSGTDNFIMDVGFKNQIQGNIQGRLMSYIRNIKNEDTKSTILSEMINTDISEKINFYKFFRQYIGSIIEELEKEYVPTYLTIDQFSQYVRDAITFFETGS